MAPRSVSRSTRTFITLFVLLVLTGRAGTQADCSPRPYARLCKPFSHNQLIEVVQEGLKSRLAQANS